ncbi:MAG: T9SS type A sorting domain-containing protein [Bacteroidales bacterium]|nr:T9SS type A sorting domain-containing protein [Bacteroidales bacterium]
MKKHLLTLIAGLLIGFVSQAQSLELLNEEGEVITGTMVTVYGEASSDEIVSHCVVKNISTASVDVKVLKVYEDIFDGSNNYYCWGSCFTEAVFESPIQLRINAGEECEEFSGHYKPNSAVGTSLIRYEFFTVNNPDDRVSYTVRYSSDPNVGIVDQFAAGTKLQAYPNPASSNCKVVYEMPQDVRTATLTVFNVLGHKVVELPLENNSGAKNLDVSSLNNGLYFYSVMINNELYGTKKLIVKN